MTIRIIEIRKIASKGTITTNTQASCALMVKLIMIANRN